MSTEQDLAEIKARIEATANATCASIERDLGIRAYWQWVSDRECRLYEPGAKPIMSIHVENLQ